MDDSVFGHFDAIFAGMSKSLTTAWQRTDQSATSAVLGDGGIYSNVDDLARWDAALYDDRLLSDASRALALITLRIESSCAFSS